MILSQTTTLFCIINALDSSHFQSVILETLDNCHSQSVILETLDNTSSHFQSILETLDDSIRVADFTKKVVA